MITRAIERAFKMVKHRGWEKSYWAFDIHDTIFVSTYEYGNIPKEFYPHAKEVLQTISKRKDIVMILFTCSHPEEIAKYLDIFKEHDIDFKYVNENPEVPNISYGCYDRKFYFNVLAEDKSGYDADNDWIKIKKILEKYPEKK